MSRAAFSKWTAASFMAKRSRPKAVAAAFCHSSSLAPASVRDSLLLPSSRAPRLHLAGEHQSPRCLPQRSPARGHGAATRHTAATGKLVTDLTRGAPDSRLSGLSCAPR